MERFCAEDYVMEHITDYRDMSFEKLCEVVGVEFRKRWQEERDDFIGAMLLQKKAIIGYEKEVGYLIDKIDEFIKSKNYFSVPSKRSESLPSITLSESLATLATAASKVFCRSS